MLPRRLTAVLFLVLFSVSTSLDAAIELSADAGTPSPAPMHDQSAVPCVGLCGCHVACVTADSPQSRLPLASPTPQPLGALTLAPESRAPELSPPPPKP